MPNEPAELAQQLAKGNIRALARCVTAIENEWPGFETILPSLEIPEKTPTIGVTGPPGAGKSSLINALVHHWTENGKQVAIIAIDPTSPYNQGSILGDRVRMNEHYNNPNVFIRSLATRGALGGISVKAIETVDLMKAAGFDYVIVETVGVGQSEVEVASLADTTVVVTIPESGDDVQVIKSGLMEVADIFVVNKADRPNAQKFSNYLQQMTHSRTTDNEYEPPVVSVIATEAYGISDLETALHEHWQHLAKIDQLPIILAEKAYRLIQTERMKDLSKQQLITDLKAALEEPDFNLYHFVSHYRHPALTPNNQSL